MRKLVVVDGNSIFSSAYFAVKLSRSDGEGTGGIYGFIQSIFKLLEDNPSHLLVVFDKGRSLRKASSDFYKSNRPEKPADFYEQLEQCKRFLKLFNIEYWEKEGYEADDLIATVATKYNEEIPVYIATRDKDMFQLCSYPNIYVVATAVSTGVSYTTIYNRDLVISKMGVPPERLADYKGLAGDSSDNIPGIKGIGPKAAITLINEFPSIDFIFQNLENLTLPSGLKGKLSGKQGIFEECRSLALFYIVDIEDWEEVSELDNLKSATPDVQEFLQFCDEWELESFAAMYSDDIEDAPYDRDYYSELLD